MPVIGYLSGGSRGPFAPYLAAFRQGLNESGFVEGQNVAMEAARSASAVCLETRGREKVHNEKLLCGLQV
jgi:hypothetical protein